jgi:hypothetical protein
MSDLVMPSKEQVAATIEAMRKSHFSSGYARCPTDYYLEKMFWSGFFAAYLKAPDSNGDRA